MNAQFAGHTNITLKKYTNFERIKKKTNPFRMISWNGHEFWVAIRETVNVPAAAHRTGIND